MYELTVCGGKWSDDWLNSLISCDWDCGPLSLINTAGIPSLENTVL